MRDTDTLSFEESDRLKGILILLIILGHIEQFFVGSHENLQRLLYAFHVSSFFFLPFLFNTNKLTIVNIVKNLRRIYIPYTIFYFLSVSMYAFLFHKQISYDIITAWIIGTGQLVKATSGFAFFWFFTALFSMILLIMSYNSASKKLKKFFLLISFFLHIIIPLIPNEYLIYFPFSFYVPLYLFIIGIFIKYIYEHYAWKEYLNISTLFIFVILLYLLYDRGRFNLASPALPNILTNPTDFLLHDLLFIVGFFSMIFLSRSCDFFTFFGKYSLAIFTIHPFIIQILNKIYLWNSVMDGVIKYILVILITYFIVKLVYLLKLDKIIYPR